MIGRGAFVRGELACAGCSVALLASMTAFGWFGVDGTPTPAHPGPHAIDAWSGLPVLSWCLAATAALGLASPLLRLTPLRHTARAELSAVVALAGTATFLALAFRVLVDLPDPPAIVDQKLGALIGLGCTAGLALTAWTAVAAARAERSRAGTSERWPRRAPVRRAA